MEQQVFIETRVLFSLIICEKVFLIKEPVCLFSHVIIEHKLYKQQEIPCSSYCKYDYIFIVSLYGWTLESNLDQCLIKTSSKKNISNKNKKKNHYSCSIAGIGKTIIVD